MYKSTRGHVYMTRPNAFMLDSWYSLGKAILHEIPHLWDMCVYCAICSYAVYTFVLAINRMCVGDEVNT